MTRSPRTAHPLVGLALLAASLVVLAALAEVGLRLFWDGFYLKDAEPWAEVHALRGWRNLPDNRATYGEPEFVTTIETNRAGFRGPAVERAKSDGRLRVFALGDSFTLGVGVENDETFCARLAALEPALEVINGGVIGYGTSQELLLLRDEALAFAPDVVLVVFFWNDVANSFDRDIARFRFRDGELVYPAAPEPALEPVAAPRRERRAWLRYSYLYRFVSDRIKVARFAVRVALGLPVEKGEVLTAQEREAAWELEFALLREIDRLVRASGARTLLVVVPEQLQVEPERRVVGLVEADYAVQERLRRFAESEGIPMLDLLPGLRAEREATGRDLYYRQDRHLTAAGHGVVARLIHEALLDAGVLER